jgi:alpha-glucosidase
VYPGEGSYVHYQDNGEDFAYENGCYNEYQFTQNAAGGVTTTLRHEGYPKYPEIVVKKI